MKKQEFYYKLVLYNKKSPNVWYSYNKDLPKSFRCKYTLNKTTIPKIGKLFIFDSISSIKNFMNNVSELPKCVILKSIVSNPIIPHKSESSIVHPYYLTESCITDFWTQRSIFAIFSMSSSPKGTVLVDSITPMEVIPFD